MNIEQPTGVSYSPYNKEEVHTLLKFIKQTNKHKKIGLISGCWDVIHAGHVHHVQEAKTNVDILVAMVAVNSAINKGEGRPYMDECDRLYVMAHIYGIQYAFFNHYPNTVEAITFLQPDIYFKSYQYNGLEIEGNLLLEKQEVEKHGGKLMFTKHVSERSSTKFYTMLSKVYENSKQLKQDFID